MKKRSFLLPMALSLAALAVEPSAASAKPATPPTEQTATVQQPGDVVAPPPLVLQRAEATATKFAGHRSHASHASHASHRSHYSSR